MTDSVRHTRAVPPEWEALTAYAQKVIPQELTAEEYVSRWSLWRLSRRILALPNQSLEANYYYGLGGVMCVMSQLLQDAGVRRRVIARAALGMAAHATQKRHASMPLDRPFEPIIDDLLHPSALEGPFLAVARASLSAMPAPSRVLVDTLTASVLYRRVRTYRMSRTPWPIARTMAVENARNLNLTARQITRNSLSGALGVYATLLSGTNPKVEPSADILRMPISPYAVERVRYSKTFINAARLRLDESIRGLGWEGQGESLHFNADVLRRSAQPLADTPGVDHLHEARLGCPAVQAAGLARDIARNFVPAIIFTARTIVPQEVFNIDT